MNNPATTGQLEELRDLFAAGYISLEGMTNVAIEKLPEITNDDEYVFIVSSNDSYDLNRAEQEEWFAVLDGIEKSAKRMIFMTPAINLRRIKKDLVPFL